MYSRTAWTAKLTKTGKHGINREIIGWRPPAIDHGGIPMKSAILILVVATAVMSGCKQQQQAQWSQGQAGQNQVVAPPAMIKSPQEVQQLESLAKANPKNANAWIALGNAQMDAQRYAEAIISYQRSLDIDPKNVDVRVDMGTCYRGVGQPEKAIEEYRKGMKIDPRHPMAHLNAGIVLSSDLGRKSEAIKEFEKYLELAPNAPNAADIRQDIQKMKAAK
jgi:tetratricopeptide (TPR) repeat protein